MTGDTNVRLLITCVSQLMPVAKERKANLQKLLIYRSSVVRFGERILVSDLMDKYRFVHCHSLSFRYIEIAVLEKNQRNADRFKTKIFIDMNHRFVRFFFVIG